MASQSYVVSESSIHQNFKSCHHKVQLDFLMSESPILLLNKKIAPSYEFEVFFFGLGFLIPLYQKVQSIRKSNSVLSCMRLL